VSGSAQPKNKQHLMVRRNARYDVSIRAAMGIASHHDSMIKFSAASGVKDGWVDCDCVDFSMGGLGLLTTVFVPRPGCVKVRLYSPVDPSKVVLECECVVRRVLMTDRRPAYHLGCSYHKLTEDQLKLVEALINDVAADVA
jgi:hypothetical protein